MRPVLGPEAPALVPIPAPTPAPVALPNNFFQEFMRTFMEKAQAPATSTAPNVEARDDTDRLLKPRNPNLYYGNLHMEYYYFC